jgi:hypothetical protein
MLFMFLALPSATPSCPGCKFADALIAALPFEAVKLTAAASLS